MSTMTQVRLNGLETVPSAALLFESDAVKADSLDTELPTVKDEDVDEPPDSMGAKEESYEPSMSRSASVEAKASNGSTKSTPSATPAPSGKKGKALKAPVQLIEHLPRAEEEALKCFAEIPANHYQYGTLGKSREALESMTCDCQYEHGQSLSPTPRFSPRRILASLLFSYLAPCDFPVRPGRLGAGMLQHS